MQQADPARYPSILTDTDEAGLAWSRTVLLRTAAVGLLLVALTFGARVAIADEGGWTLAGKPGHVVLMRHSLAPGIGDPAGFKVDDCASQRNLSEAGRAHARRVRAAFEQRGLGFDVVLSSAWCRCTETARLASGREPDVFAGLNSFFERRDNEAGQIASVKDRVRSLPTNARTLMVTHQVVITALTGRTTSSGELIVARRAANGSLTAVASLAVR